VFQNLLSQVGVRIFAFKVPDSDGHVVGKKLLNSRKIIIGLKQQGAYVHRRYVSLCM